MWHVLWTRRATPRLEWPTREVPPVASQGPAAAASSCPSETLGLWPHTTDAPARTLHQQLLLPSFPLLCPSLDPARVLSSNAVAFGLLSPHPSFLSCPAVTL